MTLRCWFQGGARFLVWCHWNEQKKTTLRSKYQRSLPLLCSKYLKNCKEILEGVMWMNMFASLKNFRPANWSDCHSSELKASYSAVTPSSFVSLPSLHQSDHWKALDEAGRSLWAPWRRMTTTHWTTLTRTKTLSAQRHASSLLLIQIGKWPFYLMAVGDNVLSSFQKFLCVSDLARKDKRILSKKYQIYFWWEHWRLITSTAEE